MRKQSEMEKKNGVVSCGATKAHSNGEWHAAGCKGQRGDGKTNSVRHKSPSPSENRVARNNVMHGYIALRYYRCGRSYNLRWEVGSCTIAVLMQVTRGTRGRFPPDHCTDQLWMPGLILAGCTMR